MKCNHCHFDPVTLESQLAAMTRERDAYKSRSAQHAALLRSQEERAKIHKQVEEERDELRSRVVCGCGVNGCSTMGGPHDFVKFPFLQNRDNKEKL